MKKSLLLALSTLLIAMNAWAFRGDHFNMTSLRQEKRASKITVAGVLTCKMASENTGQPCELKIHDAKTGKTFSLSQNGEAMKLFQSGTKQVSVEGRFEDAQTIAVSNVQAL